MNTTMVVISGLWIAILPKMKWYSIELKKLSIAYHCIGIYTALLGLFCRIGVGINDGLWILALTASILLVIFTIKLKLKDEKNSIDILGIFTSVMLVIGATSLAIIELEELTSSFPMITGALLMLSISYSSVCKRYKS